MVCVCVRVHQVVALSLTPGNPFRSNRMAGESSSTGDSKAFGLRPSTAQLMLRLYGLLTFYIAPPFFFQNGAKSGFEICFPKKVKIKTTIIRYPKTSSKIIW